MPRDVPMGTPRAINARNVRKMTSASN